MVQNDIDSVFLNPMEFGEYHIIDEARVLIVTDSDALRRSLEVTDPVGTGAKVLYFAKVGSLPNIPMEGGAQLFDGRAAIINTVYEDNGMYEITLTLHRSGGGY